MTRKASGLGKGLGALLPERAAEADEVIRIPVDKIVPNAHQPRREFAEVALRELADSIREYGVVQPLLVCRQGDGYMLVAGERRWRAAQLAGLAEVPAIVREYDDPARAAIALIENIQRENLNPIEEAAAYRRLTEEFSFTQAEMAAKVGRSRPYVANLLRLLQLPDDVQARLAAGELTPGQVRPLLTLPAAQQSVWAADIARQGWSARQVEAALARKKRTKRASKKRKPSGSLAAYLTDMTDKMTLQLGAPVRIDTEEKNGHVSGTVTISFADLQELERLLAYLED